MAVVFTMFSKQWNIKCKLLSLMLQHILKLQQHMNSGNKAKKKDTRLWMFQVWFETVVNWCSIQGFVTDNSDWMLKTLKLPEP